METVTFMGLKRKYKSVEDIQSSYKNSFWASCLMEKKGRIILLLPFKDINEHHNDEDFLKEAAKIDYSIPRRVSAIFLLYQFFHSEKMLLDFFKENIGEFKINIDDYEEILKELADLVTIADLSDDLYVV